MYLSGYFGIYGMKKNLLIFVATVALAIPYAARADTILYGSARVSVDYNDEITHGEEISGNWDVVNNSSRLGVLGSEDLGNGLSAVYQYEFGVDATEGGNFASNRPKFVGLKGGFGTLTFGNQETPYYHIAGIADIFNSGKTYTFSSWLGGGFSLTPNRSTADGDLIRLSNSLYYATPDFNGLTVEAMLVLDGSANKPVFSDGVDIWNLGVKYANGPFFAGLSYVQIEGGKDLPIDQSGNTISFDLSNWVAGLGYFAGPFSVGLIYERGDLYLFNLPRKIKDPSGAAFAKGDDAQNWYLAGQYVFGNSTIRAAYGQLDTGLDGDSNIDNWALGYQYNFSKRTSLWVEYIGRNASVLNVAGNPAFGEYFGDQTAFSVGTRVDF